MKNFYLIILNVLITICWVMFGYDRKKLHVLSLMGVKRLMLKKYIFL